MNDSSIDFAVVALIVGITYIRFRAAGTEIDFEQLGNAVEGAFLLVIAGGGVYLFYKD